MPSAGGLQYGAEDGARVADQPQVDVAVLADSAVVHVDLHQLDVLADALAVSHAEIEGCADDHEHVGLGKGLASGSGRNGADLRAAEGRGSRR